MSFSFIKSQEDSISFSTSIHPSKVYQGFSFEVHFVVNNASPTGFQAPDFDGFKKLKNRATSTKTSIINGKISHEKTWIYFLTCDEPGEKTLSPATIVVEDIEYKSNALTFNVLPKDQKINMPWGEKPFLSVEANKRESYLGEPVYLDYYLYTSENVDFMNQISSDESEYFRYEGLTKFKKVFEEIELNDKKYIKGRIKKVALFPHKEGCFTIHPLEMEI